MFFLSAFLVGLAAGSRAIVAPTAVSWAAAAGLIDLTDTWLAFLGYRWTPWIFTLGLVGELINDKLPNTPSRKVPPQFAARVVMGALAGAALASDMRIGGMIVGATGAVVGTFGGAIVRRWLAGTFGKDLPAALIEDVVALALAAIAIYTASAS